MIIALVIAAVVVVGLVLLLRRPAGPPVGTRAWEANMNINLLVTVIEERVTAKRTADEAARARLDREIAFLSKQLDEQQKILDSGDRSPGKGFIGFTAYDGP